eukprot:8406079-Lingulodinium_polyedra.AAC.1
MPLKVSWSCPGATWQMQLATVLSGVCCVFAFSAFGLWLLAFGLWPLGRGPRAVGRGFWALHGLSGVSGLGRQRDRQR